MLSRTLFVAALVGLVSSSLLSPRIAQGQIYWVGDQSTFKDNNGTASYHDGLNWLNFLSPEGILGGTTTNVDANGPALGLGSARFDIETDHRPSNDGGIPPDPVSYGRPTYLFFGEFFDERVFNNDKTVPGGIARPDEIRVRSGSYTFDFGSNNGGVDGGLNTAFIFLGSGTSTPPPFLNDPTLKLVGNGTAFASSVQIGGGLNVNDSASLTVANGADVISSHVELWGDRSQLIVQSGGSVFASSLWLYDGIAAVNENTSRVTTEQLRVFRGGTMNVADGGTARILGSGFEPVEVNGEIVGYERVNLIDGLVRIDGGQLNSSGLLTLGSHETLSGTIVIENSGELASRSLEVGWEGEGVVRVENQGLLEVEKMDVSSRGKILVSQNGQLRITNQLGIGTSFMEGEIEITSGGELDLTQNATLSVTGGKFTLADSTSAVISSDGTAGSLIIHEGGHALIDKGATVAAAVGVYGNSALMIQGKSVLASEAYNFRVESGQALIDDSNARISRLFMGFGPDTESSLTLRNGAQVESIFQATAGFEGDAQILVSGGSALTSSIGTPGHANYSPTRTAGIISRSDTGKGNVRIEGNGSLWNNVDGFLTVGFGGQGTLEVVDGGEARSVGGQIGREMTASGMATVSGAGSSWNVFDNLYVGGSDTAAGGDGTLIVESQGSVSVESELRIWPRGEVEVGATGVISIGSVGTNPTPGSVTVGPGGLLSGSGNITGNVTIVGGTLSPGASPGVLKVNGDLSFSPDSWLRLELAGATAGLYDQLRVTGDLSILGTVAVSFLNGFLPGEGDLFRFFDVSGSLDLSNTSFLLPDGFAVETAAGGGFRFVPIPEPNAIVLAALAGCFFCRRRRTSRVA